MDPEEVRRFAKELKRFNDDVQGKASALQARFAALSASWQDQEHEKFAEEFITTMKVIKKFTEISLEIAPRTGLRVDQGIGRARGRGMKMQSSAVLRSVLGHRPRGWAVGQMQRTIVIQGRSPNRKTK